MPKIPVQHGGLWRLALVVGLVILAMIVDLNFMKMPISGVSSNVSAYPTDDPVPEISVDDAKIAAARAAVEDKNYKLALNLFDEILAGDSSRMQIISGAYVEALYGEASSLVSTDPELARGMLVKALQIDPRNVDCLTQLGFTYTTQKDYQNAIETYKRAAAINPRFAGAYFNLGYLYWVTEDYAQAKDMYQRVIELKPEFLDEALFNLAMSQAKLGEQDECVKNLERAVAINPENETARKKLQEFKGVSKTSDES